MAKHQDLTSPYAIHPFAYSSNADPSSDASIDTTPYKGWINTGNSNLLKVRNAADSDWEDVSVAGAATAAAYGSNSNSVATGNAPGASTLASRADHVHLGVRSIAHTSNTYSGPVTLTASGQVGITSPASGTLNINVAGSAGGGGGSVTAEQNQLSGNVTMTTLNTYYDGPSLSLNGTYFLSGTVSVKDNSGGGAQQFTAKLWNGTTVIASTETTIGATEDGSLSLSGYVTTSGAETWKISVAANTSTNLILAATIVNGAGNNASTLVALKIA